MYTVLNTLRTGWLMQYGMSRNVKLFWLPIYVDSHKTNFNAAADISTFRNNVFSYLSLNI